MKAAFSALLLDALATLLVSALALFVYDRYVVQPGLRVGIVDVAEVYRAKEAEFTRSITAAPSEETRAQALRVAGEFARRLPRALEELPRDCNCLVVLKSAVAAASPRSMDLTHELRKKLEAP